MARAAAAVCRRARRRPRAGARRPSLFDAVDRDAGGITAEDRHGRPSFFTLTTISVGAVTVDATAFKGPESVASAAAAAKREAKRRGVGLWEIAPLEGDPANVPVPNASLSKSRGAPATSVAPRDPR